MTIDAERATIVPDGRAEEGSAARNPHELQNTGKPDRLPTESPDHAALGRRGRPGPLLRVGIVAAALLALLVALHRPILRGIGEFLVIEDAPVKADVILLLNGSVETRAVHAAELYRRGYAPDVVIAQAEGDVLVGLGVRQGWTELAVATMEMLGIPASAIHVIPVSGGTSSTQDEAEAFAAYLRQHPARRVLAVTSDYHTRRTRWTLRRAMPPGAPEIRMMAAPSAFDPRNWWRTEPGFVLTLEEYLKFAHSWARGRG